MSARIYLHPALSFEEASELTHRLRGRVELHQAGPIEIVPLPRPSWFECQRCEWTGTVPLLCYFDDTVAETPQCPACGSISLMYMTGEPACPTPVSR